MVQLHHDEELEPMHGYYGAIAMGIEVQKMIKRVSVTSLCVTVRALCILNGLHRGVLARHCVDKNQGKKFGKCVEESSSLMTHFDRLVMD